MIQSQFAAPGAFGGSDGMKGSCTVIRGTKPQSLRSKDACPLQKGDQVVFEVGGGAGYGDPKLRSASSVQRDIQSGLLSAPV